MPQLSKMYFVTRRIIAVVDNMVATSERTNVRETFKPHHRVRVIEFNGVVSKDTFEVTPNPEEPQAEIRSDRYSRIHLTNLSTDATTAVNHYRILPEDTQGHTLVLESSNKFTAICNNCNCPQEVFSQIGEFDCPNCHTITPVFWPNGVLMTTDQQVTSSAKSGQKKPKAAREPRKAQPKAERTATVDFDTLKANGEVFERAMPFNHANCDTRAYAVIISDGDNSRKLCFNTYNGVVNAKKPVPVADFVSNKKGEKSQWYAVKDVEAERKKLLKKEYKAIS